MAMLEPHPALKAVSPQASPVDMFLGDDFHHNGAFRFSYGFEYAAMMETKKNTSFAFDSCDTYEWYLRPVRFQRQQPVPARHDPHLERLRRPPELRRVLAVRPPYPIWTCQGADAQRRRLVGPGRLLRTNHDLRDSSARYGAPELPGRRAMEPRRLGSAQGQKLGNIDFGSRRRSISGRRSRRPSSPFISRTGARSLPGALTFGLVPTSGGV